MSVRQQVRSVLWFVIAMGCFVLITCPSFMMFMGWISAIPLAEANERFPEQIDPSWDGVAVYHGRPHEWGLGTIAENPVCFIACSVVLGLALACSMYGMYRSHRLSRGAAAKIDQPAPQ